MSHMVVASGGVLTYHVSRAPHHSTLLVIQFPLLLSTLDNVEVGVVGAGPLPPVPPNMVVITTPAAPTPSLRDIYLKKSMVLLQIPTAVQQMTGIEGFKCQASDG